jgi:hypothetical protein
MTNTNGVRKAFRVALQGRINRGIQSVTQEILVRLGLNRDLSAEIALLQFRAKAILIESFGLRDDGFGVRRDHISSPCMFQLYTL